MREMRGWRMRNARSHEVCGKLQVPTLAASDLRNKEHHNNKASTAEVRLQVKSS